MTQTPTNTVTPTTTNTNIQDAIISSVSHPTDACPLSLLITCWVSGTGDISSGDIVYTDTLGTIPFVGDGNFYHIQISIYPNSYSVQINNVGVIDVTYGTICP